MNNPQNTTQAEEAQQIPPAIPNNQQTSAIPNNTLTWTHGSYLNTLLLTPPNPVIPENLASKYQFTPLLVSDADINPPATKTPTATTTHTSPKKDTQPNTPKRTRPLQIDDIPTSLLDMLEDDDDNDVVDESELFNPEEEKITLLPFKQRQELANAIKRLRPIIQYLAKHFSKGDVDIIDIPLFTPKQRQERFSRTRSISKSSKYKSSLSPSKRTQLLRSKKNTKSRPQSKLTPDSTLTSILFPNSKKRIPQRQRFKLTAEQFFKLYCHYNSSKNTLRNQSALVLQNYIKKVQRPSHLSTHMPLSNGYPSCNDYTNSELYRDMIDFYEGYFSKLPWISLQYINPLQFNIFTRLPQFKNQFVDDISDEIDVNNHDEKPSKTTNNDSPTSQNTGKPSTSTSTKPLITPKPQVKSKAKEIDPKDNGIRTDQHQFAFNGAGFLHVRSDVLLAPSPQYVIERQHKYNSSSTHANITTPSLQTIQSTGPSGIIEHYKSVMGDGSNDVQFHDYLALGNECPMCFGVCSCGNFETFREYNKTIKEYKDQYKSDQYFDKVFWMHEKENEAKFSEKDGKTFDEKNSHLIEEYGLVNQPLSKCSNISIVNSKNNKDISTMTDDDHHHTPNNIEDNIDDDEEEDEFFSAAGSDAPDINLDPKNNAGSFDNRMSDGANTDLPNDDDDDDDDELFSARQLSEPKPNYPYLINLIPSLNKSTLDTDSNNDPFHPKEPPTNYAFHFIPPNQPLSFLDSRTHAALSLIPIPDYQVKGPMGQNDTNGFKKFLNPNSNANITMSIRAVIQRAEEMIREEQKGTDPQPSDVSDQGIGIVPVATLMKKKVKDKNSNSTSLEKVKEMVITELTKLQNSATANNSFDLYQHPLFTHTKEAKTLSEFILAMRQLNQIHNPLDQTQSITDTTTTTTTTTTTLASNANNTPQQHKDETDVEKKNEITTLPKKAPHFIHRISLVSIILHYLRTLHRSTTRLIVPPGSVAAKEFPHQFPYPLPYIEPPNTTHGIPNDQGDDKKPHKNSKSKSPPPPISLVPPPPLITAFTSDLSPWTKLNVPHMYSLPPQIAPLFKSSFQKSFFRNLLKKSFHLNSQIPSSQLHTVALSPEQTRLQNMLMGYEGYSDSIAGGGYDQNVPFYALPELLPQKPNRIDPHQHLINLITTPVVLQTAFQRFIQSGFVKRVGSHNEDYSSKPSSQSSKNNKGTNDHTTSQQTQSSSSSSSSSFSSSSSSITKSAGKSDDYTMNLAKLRLALRRRMKKRICRVEPSIGQPYVTYLSKTHQYNSLMSLITNSMDYFITMNPEVLKIYVDRVVDAAKEKVLREQSDQNDQNNSISKINDTQTTTTTTTISTSLPSASSTPTTLDSTVPSVKSIYEDIFDDITKTYKTLQPSSDSVSSYSVYDDRDTQRYLHALYNRLKSQTQLPELIMPITLQDTLNSKGNFNWFEERNDSFNPDLHLDLFDVEASEGDVQKTVGSNNTKGSKFFDASPTYNIKTDMFGTTNNGGYKMNLYDQFNQNLDQLFTRPPTHFSFTSSLIPHTSLKHETTVIDITGIGDLIGNNENLGSTITISTKDPIPSSFLLTSPLEQIDEVYENIQKLMDPTSPSRSPFTTTRLRPTLAQGTKLVPFLTEISPFFSDPVQQQHSIHSKNEMEQDGDNETMGEGNDNDNKNVQTRAKLLLEAYDTSAFLINSGLAQTTPVPTQTAQIVHSNQDWIYTPAVHSSSTSNRDVQGRDDDKAISSDDTTINSKEDMEETIIDTSDVYNQVNVSDTIKLDRSARNPNVWTIETLKRPPVEPITDLEQLKDLTDITSTATSTSSPLPPSRSLITSTTIPSTPSCQPNPVEILARLIEHSKANTVTMVLASYHQQLMNKNTSMIKDTAADDNNTNNSLTTTSTPINDIDPSINAVQYYINNTPTSAANILPHSTTYYRSYIESIAGSLIGRMPISSTKASFSAYFSSKNLIKPASNQSGGLFYDPQTIPGKLSLFQLTSLELDPNVVKLFEHVPFGMRRMLPLVPTALFSKYWLYLFQSYLFQYPASNAKRKIVDRKYRQQVIKQAEDTARIQRQEDEINQRILKEKLKLEQVNAKNLLKIGRQRIILEQMEQRLGAPTTTTTTTNAGITTSIPTSIKNERSSSGFGDEIIQDKNNLKTTPPDHNNNINTRSNRLTNRVFNNIDDMMSPVNSEMLYNDDYFQRRIEQQASIESNENNEQSNASPRHDNPLKSPPSSPKLPNTTPKSLSNSDLLINNHDIARQPVSPIGSTRGSMINNDLTKMQDGDQQEQSQILHNTNSNLHQKQSTNSNNENTNNYTMNDNHESDGHQTPPYSPMHIDLHTPTHTRSGGSVPYTSPLKSPPPPLPLPPSLPSSSSSHSLSMRNHDQQPGLIKPSSPGLPNLQAGSPDSTFRIISGPLGNGSPQQLPHTSPAQHSPRLSPTASLRNPPLFPSSPTKKRSSAFYDTKAPTRDGFMLDEEDNEIMNYNTGYPGNNNNQNNENVDVSSFSTSFPPLSISPRSTPTSISPTPISTQPSPRSLNIASAIASSPSNENMKASQQSTLAQVQYQPLSQLSPPISPPQIPLPPIPTASTSVITLPTTLPTTQFITQQPTLQPAQQIQPSRSSSSSTRHSSSSSSSSPTKTPSSSSLTTTTTTTTPQPSSSSRQSSTLQSTSTSQQPSSHTSASSLSAKIPEILKAYIAQNPDLSSSSNKTPLDTTPYLPSAEFIAAIPSISTKPKEFNDFYLKYRKKKKEIQILLNVYEKEFWSLMKRKIIYAEDIKPVREQWYFYKKLKVQLQYIVDLKEKYEASGSNVSVGK